MKNRMTYDEGSEEKSRVGNRPTATRDSKQKERKIRFPSRRDLKRVPCRVDGNSFFQANFVRFRISSPVLSTSATISCGAILL